MIITNTDTQIANLTFLFQFYWEMLLEQRIQEKEDNITSVKLGLPNLQKSIQLTNLEEDLALISSGLFKLLGEQ